ncbi:MAG: 3-deoxy-D-manno-octulosonic acid transferase [Acidobacteriaceae bacterium]
MTLILYTFALFVALVLGLPYWLLAMATNGKYREGLSERLGWVPGRLREGDARKTIWVHAVSVGEVLAASRLVNELSACAPQYRVLLSTTTRTGQRLARERTGANHAFYFPLDFPWTVRRYLRALDPVLLVLVETELWPNLLTACRHASIPVAVVNGRISDRSLPRYMRLRRLWKGILSGVSIFLAQSQEDVKRLKAIGAPAGRVSFAGNLKFDVRSAEPAPITTTLREKLPTGTRVLVCGSTLEGEEEILLDAFRQLLKTIPDCVMILAPRHPERFGRVVQLMKNRNETCLRRSNWMKRPVKIKPGTVILLDSIGELASVYALASVAFVGGSLVPAGGHNPLEPAQFAVPVVMGNHYANFRAIIDTLLQAEALKLATTETLVPMLENLLTDQEAANALGVRALEVFHHESGATGRAVTALLGLLPTA